MTLTPKERKTLRDSASEVAGRSTPGDLTRRGITWEAATAAVFLQAGTDILVMWHPQAVGMTRTVMNELMVQPSA